VIVGLAPAVKTPNFSPIFFAENISEIIALVPGPGAVVVVPLEQELSGLLVEGRLRVGHDEEALDGQQNVFQALPKEKSQVKHFKYPNRRAEESVDIFFCKHHIWLLLPIWLTRFVRLNGMPEEPALKNMLKGLFTQVVKTLSCNVARQN
jgi:hypothetical protein